VGAIGREEGKGGSKGWAVDNQPGTSVDRLLHHNHQKGDFQVSKKGVVRRAKKDRWALGGARGN
jgi:hypothetical protein